MVQSKSSSSTALWVNPTRGNDTASGDQSAPYRTLTRALKRAEAGDTVWLTAGTYSTASGESFPLNVPARVTVVGDEASKGRGILIDGGGSYFSETFGNQNVAICPADGAQLRGLTISNRNPKGTGIWIESTSAAIANCTLTACGREGIFATGNALPAIIDNVFQQNAASGISCFRNAKGEIRRNTCQKTGVGIALSDNTAPLVSDNIVAENTSGIVITGSARPVLRNNRVERNTGDGLVVLNTALPDLGRSQDPGGNVFQGNGQSDLRNETGAVLTVIGNLLNPIKVNVGLSKPGVEFAASEVNEQIQSPAAVVVPAPAPVTPTPTPVTPTPKPVTPPILPDLAGHWAEGFIRGLVQRQIVSGLPDGTFKPELAMNRAQFAAIVAKAFNLPEKRMPSRFVDVPNGFWATNAIAKAEAMGFLAGFPDGSFRPNQNLTRIQAIVALVNGLGLTGGSPSALGVYRDRAQIPSYATIAAATATQRRIVVNYPQIDLLEPLVDITRAGVAALIYQALVAAGQAPTLSSPYIVIPDTRTVGFADLTGHWSVDFVKGLVGQDFINGFNDGTFKPDVAMTRAQYAALLAKAFNPQPKRAAASFSDVPSSFWGAAAIAQVYQGGLLSGYEDNTFRPNQNVRRVEVLLSLTNGLGLPGGDVALLNRYIDREAVPAFARSTIATATARRLVVNYPDVDQIRPMQDATRGEVAAMVYQALVQTGRLPAINSPYIVSLPTSPSTSPAQPPRTLVLLDPGHGGDDPGALGINGLREKDVVLAIAQQTAAELKKLTVEVALTRLDDRPISLEERVTIADQMQASHFVSIHANSISLDKPEVNGLETYHYPGSTEGQKLAQAIHTSIMQLAPVQDRQVREANFYVLRNSKVPAVLIEVGFVTGQEDAPRLADASHREKLAKAIALGIAQVVKRSVG